MTKYDENRPPALRAGHDAASCDRDHRHAPEQAHDHDHGRTGSASACCGGGRASLAAAVPAATEIDGGVRTAMRIMQMDCPTEEALIRKKLSGMAGVHRIEFNLMQRMLTVDHAVDSLDAITTAIRQLGFQPELQGDEGEILQLPSPSAPWWPLALAGVAALAAEASHWLGAGSWVQAALALVAVLLSGVTTYRKGITAVLNGNLNINALMSIAVTGALLLGHWPEAAMVMVLFAIAEFIEAKSLDRARRAVEGLMQLAPETVLVREGDAWHKRLARDVAPGTTVRAQPGERIGLDGVVLSGRSTVDQAPITGESMPIDKAPGAPVYAGSINGSGELEYRVEGGFDNTLLARIVHAVHDAQGSKAPTQRFVDRFARVYTPIVCVLALAIAVVPPLFIGGDWGEWVYRALVLLVIACPCALVISTPVAIVSGLAAAARHGILVKGGVYLETGRKLKWLALDKTGTLTRGRPALAGQVVLDDTLDAGQALRLAASLAARSDHPVSGAIVQAWRDAEHAGEAASVDDFRATAGGGIQGRIGGRLIQLGSHAWLAGLHGWGQAVAQDVEALNAKGATVSVLAIEGRAQALFAVSDTVKETSRDAVQELHRLGLRTVILSGDNPATAGVIAAQVGIDAVRGGLMPDDKLKAILEYEQEGAVGMVGDGINDAPALARADVGFAMGVMGTDTAMETADVALMDDDLRKIPRFIRLSRAAHAVLVQNIVFALGIKLIFLLLTVVGLGTMWMAVFADVGASLLVVGNSLRLLRR